MCSHFFKIVQMTKAREANEKKEKCKVNTRQAEPKIVLNANIVWLQRNEYFYECDNLIGSQLRDGLYVFCIMCSLVSREFPT